MLDSFSPFVFAWAVSYLIHSTFLMGIAYALDYCKLLKKTRHAELVWRFALFGAVITTSLQILLMSLPTSSIQLPHSTGFFSATPIADNLAKDSIQPNDFLAITPQTSEAVELANTSAKRNANALPPSNKTLIEATPQFTITLSSSIRAIISYIAVFWFVVALIGCIATFRSAHHLNQLARYFVNADENELKRLQEQIAEKDRYKIKLKISDQWNSPFVTPDNTICVPKWTYSDLTHHQRDAMLAHEVAHVLRHDPLWRVATQILTRIFFFQPLHRLAAKKLSLIAELACDENAAQSSGRPHELAEALYACARVFKTNEAPALALAMASTNSPLLMRIHTLLDNDSFHHPKNANNPHIELGKFGLITLGLLCTAIAVPPIAVSFEPVALAMPFIPSVKDHTAQSFQKSKPHTNTIAQNASSHTTTRSRLPKSSAIHLESSEKQSAALNVAVAIPNLASETLDKFSSGPTIEIRAPNAETIVPISNEREKHKAEIAYYLTEFDGKNFKFPDENCVKPNFSGTSKNTVEIEEMINKVNEFATCFNTYGEQLNASKFADQFIPENILRLMTEEEIQRAVSRTMRVMGSIRLTANLIADEFTQDKRAWEGRTLDYFKGVKTRDWSSLKQLSLQNAKMETLIRQYPQFVYIQ